MFYKNLGIVFGLMLCYNFCMEKLIRTILNYDADNATENSRKTLIDAVMQLSLNMLAKDGKYNELSKIDYTFSNDVRGGRYGVSGLRLGSGIFCYGGEHYLNDLSVVAHEICHYAQDNLVDQSTLAKSNSRIICQSSHFFPTLVYILSTNYPEYMQYAGMFGLNAVFGMNEDLQKLKNYFHSYYELQSFEIDANNFSIEFLKKFVEEVEKLNLSQKEKQTLSEYKASVNKMIKSFTDYVENLKYMRKNPKTRKKIENLVHGVVDAAFKEMPNVFDVQEIDKESDHASFLVLLGQSLEIKYDDNLAHRLFDYLINKPSDEFRDNELLRLGILTQIEFSEKEEKEFRAFVESSKHLGGTNYDVLVNEKKRVCKERGEFLGTSPQKQKA